MGVHDQVRPEAARVEVPGGVHGSHPGQGRRGDEVDLAEVEERPGCDAARRDALPGVVDGCRLPHNLRDTAFVCGHGALQPAVLRYGGRDEHLAAQQLGQPQIQVGVFHRHGSAVRQYDPDHAGFIQSALAAQQRPHFRGCLALPTAPVSSSTAYTRSPDSPPSVTATAITASPSIDFTGYRYNAVTVPMDQ